MRMAGTYLYILTAASTTAVRMLFSLMSVCMLIIATAIRAIRLAMTCKRFVFFSYVMTGMSLLTMFVRATFCMTFSLMVVMMHVMFSVQAFLTVRVSATMVISLTAFGRVVMIICCTVPLAVRHSELMIMCMRVSVMFFMLVTVMFTTLIYSIIV